MDVSHPDDQVEAARGQRLLDILVEIGAQPLDVEPALGGRAPAALERYGGNVDRADAKAPSREE